MSQTLILIRHAKSDWGQDGLDDHDRPLNDRGRRAAPRIGAWIAGLGLLPDAAICSSARRTRQTWAGIASALPGAPRANVRRELYLADTPQLLQTVHGLDAPTVALIGHNPGIAALAHILATDQPAHEKFGLYPTGATTVLSFASDTWSVAGPGNGRVIAFATPRDMPDP